MKSRKERLTLQDASAWFEAGALRAPRQIKPGEACVHPHTILRFDTRFLLPLGVSGGQEKNELRGTLSVTC